MLNTSRGVKRVNRQEIEAFGNAGSIYDRLVGALTKGATGIGKNDSVLSDIRALNDAVAKNVKTTYQRKLKVINSNYGSTFEPVEFEPETSATSPGRDPLGLFK